MSMNNIIDLIKEDRLRLSTGGQRGLLIATESDKARVVNCAPFRRLQQKTQVFPLEFNAAVRSRLTHSLEVAQIGRFIAQSILKDHQGLSYDHMTAFTNTVETACLLHDIGNPPFGHFGESAIQDWVKKRNENLKDLLKFDGNPQGLRIISKLQGEDGYGLNLTSTQILSTIKYPVSADNQGDYKKIGVFDSEKSIYSQACCQLGWTAGKRFPFVHLMEAADDIAYSLSDLEDGIEKKIIQKRDLSQLLETTGFSENSSIHWFVAFKTSIINKAVKEVANRFNQSIGKILDGDDVKLIDKNSEIKLTLNNVAQITIENVYRHHEVEEIELAGYSVITGLLDHFEKLLDLDFDQFNSLIENKDIKNKGLDVHARLFRRLPSSYVSIYRKSLEHQPEDKARLQLIIDYICGMTDDFALMAYQNLQGIRVGDAR